MSETTFSAAFRLIDLEQVINTRTPVWDIEGTGDVRVKLDTDANGQVWYVIRDDSPWGKPLDGIASCWVFPHFNGAHDTYRYEPVACCFKTFADLLQSPLLQFHSPERVMWAYDVEEYARRGKFKPKGA